MVTTINTQQALARLAADHIERSTTTRTTWPPRSARSPLVHWSRPSLLVSGRTLHKRSHVLPALGSLAAAGALLLSLAATAAADGTILVYSIGKPAEQQISNPNNPESVPGGAFLRNDSGQFVEVYPMPGCVGAPAPVVPPGEEFNGQFNCYISRTSDGD
ncbi:hypothetical protein REH65_31155 [Saccharopolyspora sp. ID03-671]|uniref:hypothetical protein n=1 Tax=Saccharopolyspora sp. ID03-671 TaxID=3073066 RepID=UPI00324FB44E